MIRHEVVVGGPAAQGIRCAGRVATAGHRRSPPGLKTAAAPRMRKRCPIWGHFGRGSVSRPVMRLHAIRRIATGIDKNVMAMFRDFSQGESVLRLSALAAGRIRIFISTQKHYALHPLPGAKTKNLSRLCILVECGASLSARTAGGLTPADCGVRAGACRAVCFLLQPTNGGPGPGVPPAPLSPRMRGLLKSRASGQPSP